MVLQPCVTLLEQKLALPKLRYSSFREILYNVLCPLQVGGESLKQVERFKYLRVALTIVERQSKEMDF